MRGVRTSIAGRGQSDLSDKFDNHDYLIIIIAGTMLYSFSFPIPFQDLSANCGKQTEIGEQSQMGEQNHFSIRGEQRSMLKPGKPGVKVNLSQFKLKTVLGRGGYGKARREKR